MLRFFSRRKPRGRQEQKVVAGGGKRPPGKVNKNVLACNIILLDGSDLGLEIGVSDCVCAQDCCVGPKTP